MKQKLFHLGFKLEWNMRENLLYIQYRTAEVVNGSQIVLLRKHDIFCYR